MLLQSILDQVIIFQSEALQKREEGLARDALLTFPDLDRFALIVSGIRRCGKSTLLFQLLMRKYPAAIYVNFEDPRLYDFAANDFARLDETIRLRQVDVLLFDEIQIVPEWERYVRQKLDEGFKVLITGSNATLLGKELGTTLTGRHITKELFPFSYHEFCTFKSLEPGKESIIKYLKTGGFPEFVRQGYPDILSQLFEDILIRDIAARHGLRDVRTLQRLALYLVSNAGKLFTGNRLKSLFEFGSTSTVMEYLAHLENSYLLHFVPKFSYSLRKQIINPRKVYVVDTGLSHVISGSFSDDHGQRFENLVFLHLRMTHREIYYFAEKGECDFVVFNNHLFQKALQACYMLNKDNLDREVNGLMEAMDVFNVSTGTIVTLDQTDVIKKAEKTIEVIPAHIYFLR